MSALTSSVQIDSTDLYLNCRRNITFESCDGSLLAFIAGDMPAEMRESLEANIRYALSSCNEPLRDVRNMNDAYEDFCAIHFSWYSRCATKVRVS